MEDQQEQQLPAGACGFLYNGSTCVSQIRGPADPSIPGRAGPTTGVLETRVTTSAVSPDTRAHAGVNSRTRQLFFSPPFLTSAFQITSWSSALWFPVKTRLPGNLHLMSDKFPFLFWSTR